MKEIEYWLAEVSGIPKLIDGPHSRRSSANKAAYIIQSLGLGPRDRKFAVARVELTPCTPSEKGVNQRAIKTLQDAKKSVEGK